MFFFKYTELFFSIFWLVDQCVFGGFVEHFNGLRSSLEFYALEFLVFLLSYNFFFSWLRIGMNIINLYWLAIA